MSIVKSDSILKWASIGIWIFISSFFWAPSRDGIQSIYLLSFMIPILILLTRNFNTLYIGRITFSALLFASFGVISVLWNQPADIGHFILNWLVLASLLCGFSFLFIEKKIVLRAEKHYFYFAVLGAVISIITVVYYHNYVKFISIFDDRVWGWNAFRNPNEFGALCGIVSLVALTVGMQAKRWKLTYFFYLLSFCSLCGLIASFSRGALIAYALIVPLILIIVRPHIKLWLPPLLLLLFILILITIKFDLFIYLQGRSAAYDSRILIWKEVWDKIQFSFWFGIGMSKDPTINTLTIGPANHAHSAWLDTFFRMGLVGFLLLVWHMKEVFIRFSNDVELLPIYVWLLFGCIATLADGRCFFWEMGSKWFYFWVPIAIIGGIVSRRDKTMANTL